MLIDASAPHATRPIAVFLVADHRTLLWGLERLIETAAPTMTVVGTATNRTELFARVSRASPDVIVLDIDLKGDYVLDWLGELGERSLARVLALTNTSDPSMHEQAVVKGMRGVVHKRESPEVILRAIEKIDAGEIWLPRTSVGNVVDVLARGKTSDPDALKIDALTPRERQIILTILREKGAPSKVIAEKLHISEHTLRNNLTSIYSKLDVKGRLELYVYASSLRLLMLQ